MPWKMTIGILSFAAVTADRPTNMTAVNGTPIAGVLVGTQQMTAMVSFLGSQRIEVKKHTISQMKKSANDMKTTKMMLLGLTLWKAPEEKASSKVCQMMINNAMDPSLLSFQSMKSFLVGLGAMFSTSCPTTCQICQLVHWATGSESGTVRMDGESHTMGRKTESPSCLNTRLYIAPYPPLSLGKILVYQVPGDMYILIRTGDIKGPRKLPMVDCTTVRASLPWDFRVILTLKAMLRNVSPLSKVG